MTDQGMLSILRLPPINQGLQRLTTHVNQDGSCQRSRICDSCGIGESRLPTTLKSRYPKSRKQTGSKLSYVMLTRGSCPFTKAWPPCRPGHLVY